MTPREAIIARTAFELGRTTAADWKQEAHRVMEQFITVYHSDRPCLYAIDCVRDGQCPFDPVCNSDHS